MIRPLAFFLFLFCALVSAQTVWGQLPDTSVIDNLPGAARSDFRVEIAAGETDPATFIPVSVIRGAAPGPTVLMVAGVHGYEFSPILAAQRLADEIAPEDLSGTLIIVRVAHISAFERRSPYVNPFDRKNLNRSFPGKADGTQTQRIAWALSSRLIPAADFVLDVHGGDGAEWLDAFVGVYGGPLASGYPAAFTFAEAMGFPNLVRYSMNTQMQVNVGRSLNRQAVAQGLPTILVEIGQNGSRAPHHVDAIVAGIKNGLHTLGMLKTPATPKSPVAPKSRPQRYFDGTRSVRVAHAGIWTPHSAKGRPVEEGDVLGTIHDYAGQLVESVTATASGFTLYGLAGPPVRARESVATIAIPSTREALAPVIAASEGK
ncbi:MAG: succinylglutamate desuccinylase/aspartoacylase family protein [Pseudomonadota bacterium]